MNGITLFKPIVIRKSLDDMPITQREIAIDLLSNRKVFVPGRDGLKCVSQEPNKHLPKYFILGSEAVCYYRQSLGLPDVSITTIKVDEILTTPKDYDTLYDILFLLNRGHMRNERNIKVRMLGCPPIILWNEYRMLQEYVETLQDNNWCGHPIMNIYDVPYEDPEDENVEPEEPDHYELVRKSLVDIGYSLISGSKKD